MSLIILSSFAWKYFVPGSSCVFWAFVFLLMFACVFSVLVLGLVSLACVLFARICFGSRVLGCADRCSRRRCFACGGDKVVRASLFVHSFLGRFLLWVVCLGAALLVEVGICWCAPCFAPRSRPGRLGFAGFPAVLFFGFLAPA